MVEGRVTRGTTGVNRLRRVDRYLLTLPALRVPAPLVVDLGYGARPWTTLELADRVRTVRADARVLGLEIDRARVEEARGAERDGVTFAFGGFEVPTPDGRGADLIRAMNVLRQYEAAEVPAIWQRLVERLTPSGTIVEGTCDELGRVASWVDLDARGPQRFTISLRLQGLERPGVVAERLPKVLIHRNVPGERVHGLLAALDDGWRRAAPLAVYGPVQRFTATAAALRDAGWPVLNGRRRWALGELTVGWAALA